VGAKIRMIVLLWLVVVQVEGEVSTGLPRLVLVCGSEWSAQSVQSPVIPETLSPGDLL
jgi:hypothetical protein